MRNQILVVVQVRLSSKRLPKKALLPLAGVPMLVYLLRRLKRLPSDFTVVVATTRNRQDSEVERISLLEGIDVVRGSQDNVLSRYMKCLDAFRPKIVVRVTADNPLTDIGLIKKVVKALKDREIDYARAVEGYIRGTGVDAFTSAVLRRIAKRPGLSNFEREHIDAHILKNWRGFAAARLEPSVRCPIDSVSFTVDTLDDYNSVRSVIESFPRGKFIKINDALKRVNLSHIQ